MCNYLPTRPNTDLSILGPYYLFSLYGLFAICAVNGSIYPIKYKVYSLPLRYINGFLLEKGHREGHRKAIKTVHFKEISNEV